MSKRTPARGYASLLERPESFRSLARRRRQRRRVAVAAVVFVAVAAVVTFGMANTGGLRGASTRVWTAIRAPFTAETASTSAKGTASAPQPGVPVAVSTSATAPPGASATATPSVPASAVVEIGWVGDITPGSKYGAPPNNGRALFEYTRAYTKAPDIMVANLEGTLGDGGPSKCDGKDPSVCYAFQAPPANAAALKWAGFDVVNLANNHSYDYLSAGLRSTRTALQGAGIKYAGLNGAIATKEVNGVKVAFIGFSPYSWSPSIRDLAEAKALVRKARASADLVVVLMHAGAEGPDKSHTPQEAETAYGEFRGDSRAFAHAVIDAGADVVLGSGPHVVRGLEQYKGKLIAYSLGNFAGWKNFDRAGDLALSGLLTVKVASDGRVLGGKWLPLRIADPGVPKVDPTKASLSLVRRLSTSDFETPVQLRSDGTFEITAE